MSFEGYACQTTDHCKGAGAAGSKTTSQWSRSVAYTPQGVYVSNDGSWQRSGGSRGKHRGQSTSKWLRSVANILQGLSVSNDESWLRSVANIRLRRYLAITLSRLDDFTNSCAAYEIAEEVLQESHCRDSAVVPAAGGGNGEHKTSRPAGRGRGEFPRAMRRAGSRTAYHRSQVFE